MCVWSDVGNKIHLGFMKINNYLFWQKFNEITNNQAKKT